MNTTDILAKFIDARTELQARFDVPVLDGTPFLLVLDRPEDQDRPLSLRPVYGELYPDMTNNTPTAGKYGFRFQRRNDLCGCVSYSEESASRKVQQIIPQLPVKAVHSREWLRDNLAGVQKSINMLLANQNVTENLADA